MLLQRTYYKSHCARNTFLDITICDHSRHVVWIENMRSRPKPQLYHQVPLYHSTHRSAAPQHGTALEAWSITAPKFNCCIEGGSQRIASPKKWPAAGALIFWLQHVHIVVFMNHLLVRLIPFKYQCFRATEKALGGCREGGQKRDAARQHVSWEIDGNRYERHWKPGKFFWDTDHWGAFTYHEIAFPMQMWTHVSPNRTFLFLCSLAGKRQAKDYPATIYRCSVAGLSPVSTGA